MYRNLHNLSQSTVEVLSNYDEYIGRQHYFFSVRNIGNWYRYSRIYIILLDICLNVCVWERLCFLFKKKKNLFLLLNSFYIENRLDFRDSQLMYLLFDNWCTYYATKQFSQCMKVASENAVSLLEKCCAIALLFINQHALRTKKVFKIVENQVYKTHQKYCIYIV